MTREINEKFEDNNKKMNERSKQISNDLVKMNSRLGENSVETKHNFA